MLLKLKFLHSVIVGNFVAKSVRDVINEAFELRFFVLDEDVVCLHVLELMF